MLTKVLAFLPPPAVMLLIAMCMAFYVATPDEGRQRQVYTTGRAPAAAQAPKPKEAVTPTASPVDDFLLAGVSAVTDSGPLPLAGATAIPLLAIFVRRRFAL